MTVGVFERIGAVAHRDVRLQLSYPAQVIMSLWSVVVSVFMFFFIGKLVGNSPLLAGMDGGYFAFAVIGATVMSLSITTISVFKSTIQQERGGGTLELLLAGTAPVGVIMGAAMLVPMAFAVIQSIAYAVLGWSLAPSALGPGAWLRALPVLILIVGAFAAIGLWSAAFVLVAQRGDPFAGVFVQASSVLAGAVFPVAVLPGWLQGVAHAVPTFYGFNALRALMLSNASWASVLGDLAVLAAFDVVLGVIGWLLLRRALRFARVMGTLGVG